MPQHKVTEKDYQEFFAEEKKNETSYWRGKLKQAEKQIEKLESSAASMENPDGTGKDLSLADKISLITAIRPELEVHFSRALRNSIPGEKDFYFIALKLNEKNGRYDISCKTWNNDIPVLSEIMDTFGSGRYRLMLKYYDPEKILKHGKRGGAYTLTFFDHSLKDPLGSQLSNVELSDALKKTIAEVVECLALVTSQTKEMLFVTGTALELAKKTIGGRKR